MRITRNKIRRLIRESILKEQNISTNPIGTFTARKIQNQSKQQPPPSTGDSLAAAATAAANQSQPTTQGTSVAQAKKKGPSKIVQLQKIIGTKADGSWGPKSDAAWKAWLEADQHRNFMAIMKLGLDKNADLPKEAFNIALETNNASDLAQIAGYKKNLTGVLAMAKVIDAMTPEERHAAAMIVSQTPEGETVLAAKNINQDELIDDEFVAQTDAIISGIDKITNKKSKIKLFKSVKAGIEKARARAEKRQDQRALKNYNKNLEAYNKLGKELGIKEDPPEDMKELQERLSRGALYRRRYYGRY